MPSPQDVDLRFDPPLLVYPDDRFSWIDGRLIRKRGELEEDVTPAPMD